MGRGDDSSEPQLSEREKIVLYRNNLHGEAAAKFDEVFYPLAGVANEGGIRKALNKCKKPHKAFVAAKTAAEAITPTTEEVVEEIDWNDPDLDWNDPNLWNKHS